jgi:O-antigen/teichoic acid export membrane protein
VGPSSLWYVEPTPRNADASAGSTVPDGRQGYRVGRTAMASLAARAVGLTATLVSVPLVLNAVGAEEFGLWTTVTSGVALLNLADLGIGNSLLNAIARTRARSTEVAVARLVSSATIVFVAVAVVLAVVLVIVTRSVNWASVLRVSQAGAMHDAAPTILVVGAAMIVSLPLAVTSKVQLALQEGYRTQAWTIAGQIAALAALLIAARNKASLPVLAACLVIVPVIAQLGNTVRAFGFEHAALRPRFSMFERSVARVLLSGGLLFLFLQVSWILAFASDNLIIDRILGPQSVTEYAVPYRAFTAVATLAVLPMLALWPAYTDAFARHDHDWLRRTFFRTLVAMSALGIILGVVALAFARPILHAWVGNDTHFSNALLWGFALWLPTYCAGNALAVYFNALDIVRFQVITVGAMVVSNVVLSIVLVHAWGVSGAIYGSLISYAALVIVPSAWYLPRQLRSLRASPDPADAQASGDTSSQMSSTLLP